MDNKLTVKELLELALDEQIESSYSVRAAVVGLDEVEAGYRPLYPVTVYALSGDDTSGIVGLLFPNGVFMAAPESRSEAAYWEFDETLKYEPHYYEGENGEGRWGAKGNSWTTGDVVWDGVAGDILHFVEMETEIHVTGAQKKTGGMFVRSERAKVTPHVRQKDINSITGDWDTYGGRQRDGRVTGKVHAGTTKWDEREYGQAA